MHSRVPLGPGKFHVVVLVIVIIIIIIFLFFYFFSYLDSSGRVVIPPGSQQLASCPGW